ncbi:unnamed protein product [Cunninghamella blakesleeana]
MVSRPSKFTDNGAFGLNPKKKTTNLNTWRFIQNLTGNSFQRYLMVKYIHMELYKDSRFNLFSSLGHALLKIPILLKTELLSDTIDYKKLQDTYQKEAVKTLMMAAPSASRIAKRVFETSDVDESGESVRTAEEKKKKN